MIFLVTGNSFLVPACSSDALLPETFTFFLPLLREPPKVVFIIAPLKALADQHAASAKEYEWEPNKASVQIQVPSRSVRLRLKSL